MIFQAGVVTAHYFSRGLTFLAKYNKTFTHKYKSPNFINTTTGNGKCDGTRFGLEWRYSHLSASAVTECLTQLTTDTEQWKITNRRTANLNSYVPLKPTCHLNWQRWNLQCCRRINFVLYTCLSLKSTSLSDWTVYSADCSNSNLMH
jgi:hypothetical protein